MIKIYYQNLEKILLWYYQDTKNLLLFRGWNDELFEDIYGKCVSAIVGSSYSAKSIYPNMGRISGNQEITLTRSKLSNGNIIVYFILGSKYAQTSGFQALPNSSTKANNLDNKRTTPDSTENHNYIQLLYN